MVPTVDDANTMNYFLGDKVQDAKEGGADLGSLVRDIDEIMVLNDEAHHVRDNKWHGAVQDVHNRLIQKGGKLALQIDVTATPKDKSGKLFPQVVCDYPLVEAIYQKVVKHPLLPDGVSQEKCKERQSIKFTERYKDFIDIGVKEWLLSRERQSELGRKPLLFVMVDDTRDCDAVGEYLEKNFKELSGAVLVIHTNKDGAISEGTQKKQTEELKKLRDAANELDDPNSPYKAVVSVLMLKEGWDVKNVTTIIGLRAFGADDNILAEQTLGRGLRRMSGGNTEEETVSVIGTENFIRFIETIKSQGVDFDRKRMGNSEDEEYQPILIEVDRGNVKKDIDNLDIEVPMLFPKVFRDYEKLYMLDEKKLLKKGDALPVRVFDEGEKGDIVFEYAFPESDEEREHHTITLDPHTHIDITNIIRWFVRTIKIDMRLGSVEHILYGKMKNFIEYHLFGETVDLEDKNIVRNLSEIEVKNTIFAVFKKAINDVIVFTKGAVEVREWIKVSDTKPFHMQHREYVKTEKSVFNTMVGDSGLEVAIARALDAADDIISFAKNYQAVNFRLDYQNSAGDLSNYIPDFLVKKDMWTIYIMETKGGEYVDDALKFNRLKEWCADVNAIQNRYKYVPLYIKDEDFRNYQQDIHSFGDILKIGSEPTGAKS